METRSNPFATLAALMIGTLFIIGIGFGAYIAVQRGVVALPPAQMLVNGAPAQPGIAPRPPLAVPQFQPRPFAPPAQSAPTAMPAQAQPQLAPTAVPAPTEWQAPGMAVPAGEPMTEEYKENLEAQDRTNEQGEVCLPRSGCTKPRSGGPMPWPNGRP